MPPYRTVVVPLAFVAAMPPSVASAPGSTGNQSPCAPAASFRRERGIPGWTTARKSSGRSSRRRSRRVRSSETPPARRDDVTLEARGGAEGGDGHAMLVRPREQRRDLGRALRVDDGVRPAGRVVREVVRVLVERRVADADVPLVPEEGHELRLEIHVSHSITKP